MAFAAKSRFKTTLNIFMAVVLTGATLWAIFSGGELRNYTITQGEDLLTYLGFLQSGH
jgi:hypothetical protein